MSDQQTWRRELGEQVCRAYAESSKVVATTVAGSVGRGWADEHSDVEVIVVWSESPTDAERVAAVERSGGTIDVDWGRPNARRRWVTATSSRDGSIGEMWPHEDREWSEHYYVGGVNTGTSGFLSDTVDEWIEELGNGTLNDNAEMVAASLVNGAFVTGRKLLSSWATRLVPYPDVLARAVIERWLEADEQWWSVDTLAERNDRPAFDDVVVTMQQRLIRLLLAINGQYLGDPRPKWTQRLLAGMDRLPDAAAKRLASIQSAEPTAAATQLQTLFDETLDVTGCHFPDVDVERPRAFYRRRRAVWREPPL